MDPVESLVMFLGPIPLVLLLGASIFSAVYSYNEKIMKWLTEQSIGTRDHILARFKLMFIEASLQQVTLGLLACALIPLVLSLVVFSALGMWNIGMVVGTLGAFLGWKSPKFIVDFLFYRRIDQFSYQLVDGLSLLANGLKSGLSVQQAISLVVDEMPNPISQEFDTLLNQTKIGSSLEEAFVELSNRLPNDDVQMFVTSVVILKETGGNLAETFDTIVYTIRERIKIEKKIGAMTSMARMQGVMLFFMPFGLGGALSASDPEYMAPLFSHPMGYVILSGVLTLQMVGGVAIWKLSKVDV